MSVPRSERPLLRPMELGDILDGTLRIFRRAWKGLLLIGLVAVIPGLLAALVNVASLTPLQDLLAGRPAVQPFLPESMLISFVTTGAAGLFGLFFYPLVRGTIISLCASVILGEPAGFAAAVRAGARRYLALLGTYLMVLIPIVAGAGLMVALIVSSPDAVLVALAVGLLGFLGTVGGIILAVYWVFLGQAVAVEGLAGVAAFRRSMALVHRRFWPLLGLGVVFLILVSVGSALFSMVVNVPLMVVSLITHNAGALATAQIASVVPAVITTPFIMVGQTLAYFETRARKEGLDLELLAREQQAQQP